MGQASTMNWTLLVNEIPLPHNNRSRVIGGVRAVRI
ncbi:uncharacterized protein METZ01_LOCUS365371 [marine metagenome]|uniref:Uncharacterized protein n=1 Tax=marine metagenome TaxID=408172 RepID=A0A382STH8_9ZZZZ